MKHLLKQHKILYGIYLCAILIAIACTFASIFYATQLSALTSLAKNVVLQHGKVSDLYREIGYVFIGFSVYIVLHRLLFNPLKEFCRNSLTHFLYTKIEYHILKRDILKTPKKEEIDTLGSQDVDKVTTLFSDTWMDIVFQSVRLGLIAIYVFFVSQAIAWVYLVMTVVTYVLQERLSHRMDTYVERAKEAEVQLHRDIDDVLLNKDVIQSYRAHSFLESIWTASNDAYTKRYLDVDKKLMPLRFLGTLCGTLPSLMVCGVGYLLIFHHQLSLTSFLSAFYLISSTMSDQLHYIDLFLEVTQAKASLSRVVPYILPFDAYQPTFKDTISFDHVSFSYPDGKVALKDISFSIPSGQHVALIGKSGAGKSTTLSILSGFFPIQEGTIQIKKGILVPQFPYLFGNTFDAEITQSDSKAPTDLLDLCVLRRQDFDRIDVDGSNISGGQKQRIALARALYQNGDTYYFDESLSALDNQTAKKVMENLCSLDKTMIFVLHQEELLPYVDRILVFNDGHIVFDGSYQAYKEVYLHA